MADDVGATEAQDHQGTFLCSDLERTFAIIKPDAVRDGNVGEIIAKAGQWSLDLIWMFMSEGPVPRVFWEKFYEEHKDKSFYEDLIDFQCSGPVVFACFEGVAAIETWRNLMGPTDPMESRKSSANDKTLRSMYGSEMPANAVHGSDSAEAFIRERDLFLDSLTFLEGGAAGLFGDVERLTAENTKLHKLFDASIREVQALTKALDHCAAERDEARAVARAMVKAWDANDPEAQCDAIAAIEDVLRNG
jgi:nucleoside-diphosphate kinase